MNNILKCATRRSVHLIRNVSTKTLDEIVIAINDGQLKGSIDTDHYEKKYFSFQGIPYAKPPIGDLRFKDPLPNQSWSGIRDATISGEPCYSFQRSQQCIMGSEDCLYLNVYTSQLPEQNTKSKPVMVWFHGGAFHSGWGSKENYGPDFLLPHDVVVVSVTFRFGLLGFLNFKDPSLGIPGNAGLKDHVMALQWVQKNIDKFNGDPNNITIFGESSGGASVHYLMLSPMAKGLFHKAIIQSASALCYWTEGQASATVIAKRLNLPNATEKEIFEILNRMTVEEIYRLQTSIPDPTYPGIIRPTAPIIEDPSAQPALISEHPIDTIKSGKFAQIPLMIGYNSREGMLTMSYLNKNKGNSIDINFENMIPHNYKIRKGSDISKNAAERVKIFFYGTDEPTIDNLDNYYLLSTYNLISHAVYSTVRYHTEFSSMPVYFYRMSIDSKLNTNKRIYKITTPGVCHADDVCYLFKTARTPKIQPNSIEDIAMNRFVRLWTNFAKTGNPNPVEKDDYITTEWKPTEKERYHFLEIGENLTMGTNPDDIGMKFWDGILQLGESKMKL